MTGQVEKNKINEDDFCKTLKANWPSILIWLWLIIYTISMGIIPAIKNKWDWHSIQNIWYSWQTYNSATIALIASVIAYKATTYAYKEDRANNFRAAKSKLPQALSQICDYTKRAAQVHQNRYLHCCIDEGDRYVQINPLPIYSNDAVKAIVECIKYAPPNVGDFLAKILENLQVIDARLPTEEFYVLSKANEIYHIRNIAKFHFKVVHLFPFARNESEFTLPGLLDKKDELDVVYFHLNIKNIPLE